MTKNIFNPIHFIIVFSSKKLLHLMDKVSLQNYSNTITLINKTSLINGNLAN